MNKKKVLYFENLKRFWNKTEAWIETNIQALFDNDEELSYEIANLKSDIITETEYNSMKDSDYTEEEISNVLNDIS